LAANGKLVYVAADG